MTVDLMLVQCLPAVAGIILGALISEDAATLGAASLASARLLHPVVAVTAAALGIWIGDLGLYALARHFGPAVSSKNWFARRVTPAKLETAQSLAQQWGTSALALSRFMPGTRLPATVASGFLRMPLRRFATVSAVCSVVWVIAVFWSVVALRMHSLSTGSATLIVAVTMAALGLIVARRRQISAALARWSEWEFWPAWLFYAPVAAMCLWLAGRFRGLMLPTVANLNQKNGGLIGESKAEVLQQLQKAAPEYVAQTYLVPAGPLGERLHAAAEALAGGGLQFPFVFKPDVGQRGAGFRIIHDWQQAREYLERVQAPVVLQQYVAGPHEAGIFYYRLPGEAKGRIFAITQKVFPTVRGDGASTVGELIAADPRARLMAHVYLKRLGQHAGVVLARGATLGLVEAGNHCQGCIFEDGQHLFSATLEQITDQISQRLDGFYVGRYDVRYSSEDDLRAGRFTIIELNGASAEATSIYDARNSLRQAYAVLYRQWELVYRIGAANRSRGSKPAGLLAVLRDWLSYQKTAASYPLAD